MKKYDEIMDKIAVTEEMRARILTRLREADHPAPAKTNVIPLSALKKYISIAACFAVLLAGAFLLPKLFGETTPEQTMDVFSVEEVSSLAALEKAVGFSVPEVTGLPFVPDSEYYLAYGSDLAEVVYERGEETACFRKSPGTEDNSGDYNEYAAQAEITVGSASVTLKGNGGAYTLAIWSEDGYSYSLSLTIALSPTQWQTLLAGLCTHPNA